MPKILEGINNTVRANNNLDGYYAYTTVDPKKGGIAN